MKFLRGVIITACLLLASCALGQDKPKGYDLGACAPDGFFASHVVLTKGQLAIDWVSEKEGEVVKLDTPLVYKLESENGSRQIYLLEVPKHKLEIMLDFEKNAGVLMIDEAPAAVLFLTKDADGADLAKNASAQFKSCVDLVSGSSDNSH